MLYEEYQQSIVTIAASSEKCITSLGVVVCQSKILRSDFAVGKLAEASSQLVVPISVVRRVVELPFRTAFITLRHRVTENAVCAHTSITISLLQVVDLDNDNHDINHNNNNNNDAMKLKMSIIRTIYSRAAVLL